MSTQTSRWSEVGNGNVPTSRKSGSVFSGQKTPELDDLQVLPRQHVVGPEVAGRGVGEVRRVVPRVGLVGQVRPALESVLLDGARAVGRRLGVHERVLEQELDRAGNAVPVERIGVLVAGDHEERAGLQATRAARVVVDVAGLAGRDVVGPEPDLVVVPAPVEVDAGRVRGRIVEDGRSRMADEEVDYLAADEERQVPVALRGEPEDALLRGRVPSAGAGGPDRPAERPRHVLQRNFWNVRARLSIGYIE